MPNHVHLILVPRDADGLRAALGEAHRRYTRHINLREGWRGYLWQGRFASFPMDEPYLLACARYVELNPVRAKLARRTRDWRWSSARAHVNGRDDGLVTVRPLLDLARTGRHFSPKGSVRRSMPRSSPASAPAGHSARRASSQGRRSAWGGLSHAPSQSPKRREIRLVSPELPPELPVRLE